MVKLSIIVPVYNVEKTLRRCLDSILTQSFRDYELLLVDDGSTDSSGAIADAAAEDDGRIRVFHKPNGGLSDARNHGLDRARGEYVCFIDSDDEIAPDTLRPLIGMMDGDADCDMLEFPVSQRVDGHEVACFRPAPKSYGSALEWLSAYGFEHCWACNKIYRRSLTAGLHFIKGKVFEDVYFIGACVSRNPRIAATTRGLYIYHDNAAGITAGQRQTGLAPLLDAQISVVRSLGIDTRRRRWHRLYLNMTDAQLHAYPYTGKICLWSQRVAIQRYRSLNDLLKALSIDILGLRLTCRLFKMLKAPSLPPRGEES